MHPSTRTYTDLITPQMDHETACRHMNAYVNVALLRRGRTLRFAAIIDVIDEAVQAAVDEQRLPTDTEIDDLAATVAALEASDPTRDH